MSKTTVEAQAAPSRDRGLITLFSILLGLNSLMMIYFIIIIWPNDSTREICFTFLWRWYHLSPEQCFMVLMALGGALGASVYLILSFTTFVGNRKLVLSWVPWYALRPFVGAGLALIFYFLLRGGILTYTPGQTGSIDTAATLRNVQVIDSVSKVQESVAVAIDSISHRDSVVHDTGLTATLPPPAKDTATKAADCTKCDTARVYVPIPLNPFGMMAIACMVGMFCKEAADKLAETFKTLFNVKEENKPQLKDGLHKDGEEDDTDGGDDNDNTPKTGGGGQQGGNGAQQPEGGEQQDPPQNQQQQEPQPNQQQQKQPPEDQPSDTANSAGGDSADDIDDVLTDPDSKPDDDQTVNG